MEPYKWYPQRAGRVDLVMPAAKETGKIDDPVLRQEIAKLLIMAKSAEWTARRARVAQEQGRPQGRRDRWASWCRATSRRQAARVPHLHDGCRRSPERRGQPDERIIAEILSRCPAGSNRRRHRRDPAQTSSPNACSRCQGAQRRHRQAVRDVPRNIVS